MRQLLALGVLLGAIAACTNVTRTEQAALSAVAAYGAMREGD